VWAVWSFGTSNINLDLAVLVSLFVGVIFPVFGLALGPAV
jgi:hypothetical protein